MLFLYGAYYQVRNTVFGTDFMYLTDTMTDNIDYSSTNVDRKGVTYLTLNVNNSLVKNIWGKFYAVVEQCNILIDQLEKRPRAEPRQQRKHHRRGQIHPRLGLFQPRPAVGRRAPDDGPRLLDQGRQHPSRTLVGRCRLLDHHLRHGVGSDDRRGKALGHHRLLGRKLSADDLAGRRQDVAGPDVPCPQRST